MSTEKTDQVNALTDFQQGFEKIFQAGNQFPKLHFTEWNRNGDYFTKFSLYSDFSSGKTTSQTSITVNELNA